MILATAPRSLRPRRRAYPGIEALLALFAATAPLVACAVSPGDEEPTEPAGCLEPSEADSRFSLVLDGWPAAENAEYEIAAACTVQDVRTDGDDLVTTLECDDAGEPRPATLHIAATAEGTQSWAPGSEVALAYVHLEDTELETGTYRSLSLRRADDQALLVAAMESDGFSGGEWIGSAPVEHLAPVVGTEDREACGWMSGYEGELPMRITLELEGESLELVNRQRGVLPIPGETDRLAVDLGEASVGHCCHYISWISLLVRRVS